MNLSQLDWAVIGIYFLLSIIIGILGAKQAGKDTRSFFLASGNMPWWLLGISLVATTFSTDTPDRKSVV
jgi:Na+/proline symporter